MPRLGSCTSCSKAIHLSRTSAAEPYCRPCRAAGRAPSRTRAKHGDETMYSKQGCRCETCREGQTRRMREYAARRRAEGRPIDYADYRAHTSRSCEQCGAGFLARADNPGRFCSVGCANDFQGGSGRAPRADRFRISDARRLAIYERDGWACQICHEPVDRAAEPTGAWFPSLDHITPRSLGGGDDDNNLRLAHRWCNSVRGNLAHYTDADLQGVA